MPENRKRAVTFPRATVSKSQVAEVAKAKKALGCTDIDILVDTEKDMWVLVYTLPVPADVD